MEANEVFISALNYERKTRWKQAVKKYQEIFSLLRGKKFDDRKAANGLKMFLYECHFHCGEAHHHLGQTTEAISHYVTAMRVISRKKINCCVGCITGKVLHFHVPALAKISICLIQQGEYETALKRVEEALVLDFKNPDLFCIRACVYYLLNKRNMAITMKDVNFAIWLRPKHVCAWLLRGIFKEKQKQESTQKDSNNPDLEMACSLEASVFAYASLKDLSTSVHTILNRYLPSLRISHTITPNDIFNDLVLEPQTSCKVHKCNGNSGHKPSFARDVDHRRKSGTNILKEKETLRPKQDQTFTCRTSVSRKSKFHEDIFLNKTAKSGLNLADMQLLGTLLPRKRSSEFQRSNMSLTDYKPKTPFPANGIRVKDLLDVRVEPEHLPLVNRTGNGLGMMSYSFTNQISLSHPGHTFKIRRHEEQERLYPRMWTQNQCPVRIPDVKGCRSTADLENT